MAKERLPASSEGCGQVSREVTGGAAGPHAFSLPHLVPGEWGSLLGGRGRQSPPTRTPHVDSLVFLQPHPTPAFMHTTHSGTYTLTLILTPTHIFVHTHTYTHLLGSHTYTHTSHTYSYTFTHSHAHTHTHNYTYTPLVTHIYAHAHAYTYSQEHVKSAVREIILGESPILKYFNRDLF